VCSDNAKAPHETALPDMKQNEAITAVNPVHVTPPRVGMPTAPVVWSETRQQFPLFGMSHYGDSASRWVDGNVHKRLYRRDRLADGVWKTLALNEGTI
jgi:hypothetical protein